MGTSMPTHAVAAFAAFVRHRLADIAETVAPMWSRHDDDEPLPEGTAKAAARQFAMVIVGAAAPFATTSQARVRLLRQAQASGLLTAREAEHAVAAIGAPR